MDIFIAHATQELRIVICVYLRTLKTLKTYVYHTWAPDNIFCSYTEAHIVDRKGGMGTLHFHSLLYQSLSKYRHCKETCLEVRTKYDFKPSYLEKPGKTCESI